jgi:hypothetical protein
MSTMIEVYLGTQHLGAKGTIVSRVSKFDGSLTFEEKSGTAQDGVCLTFEFDSEKQAKEAIDNVLSMKIGVHVEGPCDY